MKKIIFPLSLFFTVLSCATLADADCSDILGNGNNQSTWVRVSGDQLIYRTTPRGDQIMDFSHAGYGGGGVAFPTVPNVLTVNPSGGDDTAAIQNAINQVSNMPLENGIRGAVLLAPGTFTTSNTLNISASGVVLRGSGNTPNGTIVNLTGSTPHYFLWIQGDPQINYSGSPSQITDSYVPSGATQVHVEGAQNFQVGQRVFIQRPATQDWINMLGMEDLCGSCVWIRPGTIASYDRIITDVNSAEQSITLDAPIADSLDSQYLEPTGATVAPYAMPGRLENVGFESMTINAPPPPVVPVPYTTGATFSVLKISAAENAWAQKITGVGFISGVMINEHSKWITLQDFAFENSPRAANNGPELFQYNLMDGQLVLCNRCTSSGDFNYSFTTANAYTQVGPNVILNSIGNNYGFLEPHMRWSTGLLVDNFTANQGGISYMSRGTMGSGHGWTMAWGVIWNSAGKTIILQQPPSTYVWAIGAVGILGAPPFPNGGPPHDPTLPNAYPATIESWGNTVTPQSLYLAQLCVRSGRQAVANLGY